MFIVLPSAIVLNDSKPYKAPGSEVFVAYCRVQYMGGEIRCANPNKIPDGPVKDARILINLRPTAKAYGANETRSAGAIVTQECQFLKLDGVSK